MASRTGSVVKRVISMRLGEAVKLECDRQQVGEDRRAMLTEAYMDARVLCWGNSKPTLTDILHLARTIEPDNKGEFRTVPVVFRNGAYGPSADTVPNAMLRLVSMLDEDTDPDEWIKDLLGIHPFTDGNGRLAWLLRTWLTGTWDDLEPLPDYGW